MPSLYVPASPRRIARIAFLPRIAIAAVAILVAWQSIASAQSPSYTTRPRSNGGRAAGFGTMSPGGGPSRTTSGMPRTTSGVPRTGGSQTARNGVMNGAAGGGAAAPRGGASRPSIGSTAPSTPFMGNGSASRSSTPRASGPGMQIFSAEQLKAGRGGQPVGVGRRR